jgi:hypothetical protein
MEPVFSESRRSISDSYLMIITLLVVVALGGFIFTYFRSDIDRWAMVIFTVIMILLLATLVYVLRMNLTTQVFDDRVVVTARKDHTIMFSEIESHSVREYSSIKDYGREDIINLAFIVTGTKRGVEIVCKNGEKVYIASDFADALDATIKC